MVRRHTYENMAKSASMNNPTASPLQSKPATSPLQSKPTGAHTVADRRSKEMVSTMETGSNPTGVQGSPSQPAGSASLSKRGGYENVPITSSQPAAARSASLSKRGGYENVQVVSGPTSQTYIPKPLPRALTPSGRSLSSSGHFFANNTPLSPNSSLPQHNLPEGGWPSDVTTPTSAQHQVSTAGSRYSVEDHKQQDWDGGTGSRGGTDMRAPPPTIPLRAFQRMSSRENIQQCFHGDGSAATASDKCVAEGPARASTRTNTAAASTYSTADCQLEQPGKPGVEEGPTRASSTSRRPDEGEDLAPPQHRHDTTPPEGDPTYEEIQRGEELLQRCGDGGGMCNVEYLHNVHTCRQ